MRGVELVIFDAVHDGSRRHSRLDHRVPEPASGGHFVRDLVDAPLRPAPPADQFPTYLLAVAFARAFDEHADYEDELARSSNGSS